MNSLRKILLLCDSFYLIAGGLLGPIYALYVQKIGGDLLDASGTFSLFMITAGIVTFFLAFLEDKAKYQELFVVVGYGLGVIGFAGYLFVDSTFKLFLVQAVLGIAVAVKDPAYDALLSRDKHHLVLAWGEWEAIDYVALGLGAFLGGLIAQYLGFTPLLWCMFGLSLISLFISLFLLRHKKKI